MLLKIFPIVLLCLALSGCEMGAHKESQRNELGNPPRPAPAATLEVPEVTHEEFDAAVKTIRAESQASNNAAQQSISGLGLNLQKIAEKVDASLVKLSADFNTSIKAVAELSVKIHADLKNEISTQIKSEANLNAQAVAQLEARLNATINTKFEALAQAQAQALANMQAGIGNKIESTQRTNTAGRDSVSTEFTKEMRDTILGIVGACFGVVLLLQERSRRRAHNLSERFLNHHFNEKGEKPCERPGVIRRVLSSLY